jgi:N-acetylmuramoyl-L-alanine amidase-like protein
VRAFCRIAIVVGSALGAGVVIALFSRRRGMPPAPPDIDSPVDGENCSRRFFPSPNSSGKRARPPIWIVLHDTEGGDARSNALYFMNTEGRRVSAHVVVDDTGACYRSVPDDEVAWAAGDANPRGLHIELAAPEGAATGWTRADWLRRDMLLEVAAAHVARWSDVWGIPIRFVDAAGLRKGVSGITTHAEVTKAFGGDHVDPGPGFPLDDFLGRVRGYEGSV